LIKSKYFTVLQNNLFQVNAALLNFPEKKSITVSTKIYFIMFLTLIIIRHFLEQQFKIISEGSYDPEDAITICFSILKYNTSNCNNSSQHYSFVCIYDQINQVLVSIRDLPTQKLLKGSLHHHLYKVVQKI